MSRQERREQRAERDWEHRALRWLTRPLEWPVLEGGYTKVWGSGAIRTLAHRTKDDTLMSKLVVVTDREGTTTLHKA